MVVVPVVVVFVMFVVVTFGLPVNGHVEERAGEAAARRAGGVQLHAMRHHRREAGERRVAVGDEFEQRGREHVARRARLQLEVKGFHEGGDG